jgi:hypothetical protein
MAIFLPIVSEFKDDGIRKAAKEFKSLEGAAAKASFAIKKAAVPAAAALGGLAIAGVDAAKAAAEDAAAAEKLAVSLRNNTRATDEQIASIEDYISKTSVAAAVADDELRPALDNLIRGTKDAEEAQGLLNLALDISAGTGKDLDAVTQALSKAYNGNLGPLKKLDPALAALVDEGASAEEVFAELATTFRGQAATAAGTAEGKFKSMQIALGEAKESIGAALLPVIVALASKLTELATFVQNNTELVLGLGIVIGGLAVAVIAINAALTTWAAISAATAAINTILGTSFSALWVATGAVVILAVIAALIILQKKFNIFGKAVDGLKVAFDFVWGGIKKGFSAFGDLVKSYANLLLRVWGTAFNLIAKAWNNTLGGLSFSVPDWVPGIGGKGFTVPTISEWNIPQLADGGIVNGPTLAMIGEAGPEAVVPLDKGYGGTVININGALDPSAVARQIRQILTDEARRSGNRTAIAPFTP